MAASWAIGRGYWRIAVSWQELPACPTLDEAAHAFSCLKTCSEHEETLGLLAFQYPKPQLIGASGFWEALKFCAPLWVGRGATDCAYKKLATPTTPWPPHRQSTLCPSTLSDPTGRYITSESQQRPIPDLGPNHSREMSQFNSGHAL